MRSCNGCRCRSRGRLKASSHPGYWLTHENLEITSLRVSAPIGQYFRTAVSMAPPAHKKRRVETQNGAQISNGLNSDGSSRASSEEESGAAGEDKRPQARAISRNENRNGPLLSTSGGANSSMLQLQIDELLSKVRPDYERRMVKAENALRKLKGIVERIPAREAKSVRSLRQKLVHTR